MTARDSLPGWHCRVPDRLQPQEAELYRRLREAHCDANEASHDCQGRVIVDRNGVTLKCPRCGDARKVQP
jgi:hypothetical protein